jgi:hypothetical protein
MIGRFGAKSCERTDTTLMDKSLLHTNQQTRAVEHKHKTTVYCCFAASAAGLASAAASAGVGLGAAGRSGLAAGALAAAAAAGGAVCDCVHVRLSVDSEWKKRWKSRLRRSSSALVAAASACRACSSA